MQGQDEHVYTWLTPAAVPKIIEFISQSSRKSLLISDEQNWSSKSAQTHKNTHEKKRVVITSVASRSLCVKRLYWQLDLEERDYTPEPIHTYVYLLLEEEFPLFYFFFNAILSYILLCFWIYTHGFFFWHTPLSILLSFFPRKLVLNFFFFKHNPPVCFLNANDLLKWLETLDHIRTSCCIYCAGPFLSSHFTATGGWEIGTRWHSSHSPWSSSAYQTTKQRPFSWRDVWTREPPWLEEKGSH